MRVAAGGMAEIYSARDPQSGVRVALKRCFPSPGNEERALLMFRREATIACALMHENIVRGTGLLEDDRFGPILVMELLEGQSAAALSDRLRASLDAVPLA